MLIGHNVCHIITEASVYIDSYKVKQIVKRITENEDIKVDLFCADQDEHLAKNQDGKIRCGHRCDTE